MTCTTWYFLMCQNTDRRARIPSMCLRRSFNRYLHFFLSHIDIVEHWEIVEQMNPNIEEEENKKRNILFTLRESSSFMLASRLASIWPYKLPWNWWLKGYHSLSGPFTFDILRSSHITHVSAKSLNMGILKKVCLLKAVTEQKKERDRERKKWSESNSVTHRTQYSSS